MKILAGLLLFTFCSSVTAGTHIGSKKISTINIHPTSGISFKVEGGHANPDSCAKTTWYRVNRSSNYEQAQLSFLMMNYSQNKKINFYLSGCLDDYPKVSYIQTANE